MVEARGDSATHFPDDGRVIARFAARPRDRSSAAIGANRLITGAVVAHRNGLQVGRF